MTRLLKNVALTLTSLLLFGLLCEFVVFRYVVRASDIPRNAYIDHVMRFQPHQAGIYRIRNEISARYRINADGWNSAHASYRRERTKGRELIAIVGDSYVEALQVDYDKSLAELLEECSGEEVHRFAISGSPLSQYLHVIRTTVTQYQPDHVIVVVVHNDFQDSYRLRIGRYTESFAQFRVRDGKVFDVPPHPYRRHRLAWVRGSATYRFLVDRMGVRVTAIKEIVLKRGVQDDYAANIRQSSLRDEWPTIRLVAAHFFSELADVAQEAGFQPVVVVDAVRSAIYKSETGEALRLNALCVELGAAHGVQVIDLHPVFADRFAHDDRKFEFKYDGHWNAYAHGIVASVLCQYLQ